MSKKIKLTSGVAKAKQKKTITKVVKKILRKEQELKFHTVDQAATPIFVGSNFNSILTAIPQNITDSGRVGDELDLTSCNIRGSLSWFADVGNGQNCAIRLIVYQYKPNNGLLPPSLARLLNNDSTGSPNVSSHQVIDHQADYHILVDRTYTMAALFAAAGTLPDSSKRFFNIWVPMKKVYKKLQYDSALLGHNNALYLAVFCDHPVAAVGDPNITFQARLRFTDS